MPRPSSRPADACGPWRDPPSRASQRNPRRRVRVPPSLLGGNARGQPVLPRRRQEAGEASAPVHRARERDPGVAPGEAAPDQLGRPIGRQAAFSELDFGTYVARDLLKLPVNGCRAVMVRTPRWKYVHFDGFPPQLFDLESDPQELHDLGRDLAHAAVREEMKSRIFVWMRGRKNRVAMTDAEVDARFEARRKPGAQLIGRW